MLSRASSSPRALRSCCYLPPLTQEVSGILLSASPSCSSCARVGPLSYYRHQVGIYPQRDPINSMARSVELLISGNPSAPNLPRSQPQNLYRPFFRPGNTAQPRIWSNYSVGTQISLSVPKPLRFTSFCVHSIGSAQASHALADASLYVSSTCHRTLPLLHRCPLTLTALDGYLRLEAWCYSLSPIYCNPLFPAARGRWRRFMVSTTL